MLQCTSSNLEVLLILIMVLCNLPTCLGYPIKSVDKNGLPAVNQLLTSLLPLVSKYVMMILCNLASYELLQHFSRIQLDEWYQSGMQGHWLQWLYAIWHQRLITDLQFWMLEGCGHCWPLVHSQVSTFDTVQPFILWNKLSTLCRLMLLILLWQLSMKDQTSYVIGLH